MKGLFQSANRIYCLTNVFVCLLCTGYLCTGYSEVNSLLDGGKENSITVDADTEPLSGKEEIKSLESKEKVLTVATNYNTSRKKYVKPSYDSITGEAVVDYAKNYLGLRYVSGGYSLTNGTDCSGFTKLIFREFGINLSRSVKVQATNGKYVQKSDLQKGDLVFYGKQSGVVSHVGIYIGDGKVIHQSTPRNGVKIDTVNMMIYITARRVITKPASITPTISEEVSNAGNSNQTDVIPDTNINNDELNNNDNISDVVDSVSNTNIEENNTPNEDSTTNNNANNDNNTSNDNNNDVYTSSAYGTN